MLISELLRIIQGKHARGMTTFIGIDGCGGAGKTTLASDLQKLDKSIAVVHMDEFDLPYAQRMKLHPSKKPIGADNDWKRLAREVFIPLREGQHAGYAAYNLEADKMQGRRVVEPYGIVVVEGVYAIRKELSEFYDLTIWIEVSKNIRLERGLRRDGENARERWLFDWIPMEDRYVAVQEPHLRADIVLKGS